VRKIVEEVIAGEIEVVGDMPIALEAAFGAGQGVVVIAGTGSFAYGRNAQGRTARAGGWGFSVSDEGSAHWIGRVAVGNLLRAIDEGAVDGDAAQSSQLFREMTKAWKLESLDDLVRTANSSSDFEALFPAALVAADRGDAVARDALTRAGGELAQLAGIVARRLFGQSAAGQTAIPVGVAGGVFRHSQIVREVFCGEVEKVDLRLEVNPQIVDPVLGALQMARKKG
jgi:N-acetylglucosamine kinase-like BadF-type ATPase